ncbi:MAG: hypothetical protein UEE32_02620 [Oscillospiraceae bacterium]|nr:hypothetical protein [Oscillospiraceae bacterium]
MEKVYRILKTAIWCFVGVFIGNSCYEFKAYKTYPELYAMQSAPWYYGILMHAVLTAVIIAGILIVMALLKKRMK